MKPFYIHKPILLYKKAFLWLCFLCCINNNIEAQAWFQKLYALNKNDSVSGLGAVKQVESGNYILAGGFGPCSAINNCTGDGLIIKTDNSGNVLWTRIMGGIRSDGFGYAIQTTDGNYVFAGLTESFGVQATANVYGQYIYVVKMNPNGDTLYTRIYGGTNTDYSHNNNIQDLQATSDGGFIMTADVNYKNTFPYAYSSVLIKCNAQGDTLWTKRYDTPNKSNIWHITEIADSGYIFVGAICDSVGSTHSNGCITRIDKNGNVLWTKMYGGAYDEYFGSVLKCGSGYLATGGSYSFSSNHNVNYMYAVRLDSLGDTLWTKVYGPVGSHNYTLLLNDSTALLVGFSLSSLGDYAVLKINTNTGVCLMKNYYAKASSIGTCDATQDGGFVIPGSTNSYGSQHGEAFLLKVDSTGNAGCNQSVATMTISSTQTQISSIAMQTYHYPMYVNSTQTQITYNNLPDSVLCSSPAGIEKISGSNNQLLVYPNPNDGNMSIEYKLTQDAYLEIIDINGTLVGKYNLPANNTRLDVRNENLSNGVYIYHVIGDKISTGKFVIMK